jgi:phytoene desaturase (3,4-didehydrolycopene-forming)
LLAATELTDGVYYPIGGFKTIRDGIENVVREMGVEVSTSTEAEGIVVDGGRVLGVRTATGLVEADIVVCNRDLADSYALVEGDPRAVAYAEAKHKKLGTRGILERSHQLSVRR